MLDPVNKALEYANTNFASTTLSRNIKQNNAPIVEYLDALVDLPVKKSIIGIDGILDVYTVSKEN